MRFKKIYVEITNRCNLNCDFCIHNKRKIKDMSFDEYKDIISKISGYTSEIYLHVMGEPLIHKDINRFIDYASKMGILVNITTNGYLIKNIYNNKNIHRLNISMHSFNERNGKSIDEYLSDIFTYMDSVREKTFCSIRLWVNNKYSDDILSFINMRYGTSIKKIISDSKIKISNNLIIDTNHEFIWPDINNSYYNENGKCLGLIDHIGILCDGTIIPCCLDSNGSINLGNIFNDELDDVLSSNLVNDMINGFRNNKKICELCKHCYFLK